MELLTLIIPVYNDAESLDVLLEQWPSVKLHEVNLLLVDNGSSDPSVWEIICNFQSTFQNTQSLRLNDNLGFGGAVVNAIRLCDSKFVGWMPANLKVGLDDAITVYKCMLESGNDCGKGYRVRSGVLDNIKSKFAGYLLSVILLADMRDFGGTPTVIDRKSVNNLVIGAPSGVDFDAFVTYKLSRLNLPTIRPKINYGRRLFGVSHWQTGLKAEWKLFARIASQRKTWKS